MEIIVEVIPVSYQDHKNYVYLVFDKETGDGIIIDAAFDSDKIKEAISRSNVSIRAVLVTHHHPDHTDLAGSLSLHYKAQVIISKKSFEKAALAGYSAGADLERRFAPESTYNRTNEIKLGLLTGARDLGSLSPDIDELERQITRALEKNPTLGDSGWAWADLGDLRALRGDGGGAERAYSTFIAKAKPTSPRTTLEVLSSILKVLDRQNDKRATTVRQSLEFVRGKLDLS